MDMKTEKRESLHPNMVNILNSVADQHVQNSKVAILGIRNMVTSILENRLLVKSDDMDHILWHIRCI